MEFAILTGDILRQSLDDLNVPEIVDQFLDGKFDAVLKSDAAKHILGHCPQHQHNLETLLTHNVQQYVSTLEEGCFQRELDVLVIGAACLHLFVQNNWCGPSSPISPSEILPEPFTDEQIIQENALAYLSEDGEPIYNLSRFIGYLHLARAILLECRHLCTSLQTWDWWLARCLMVQQMLLEQKSPSLRATILDALERISKKESLVHDDKNRDMAVLFHIEASRLCQVYWEDKMAKDHVKQAGKLASITSELTGVLGKRTRFQQEHKAQLVVNVTRSAEERSLPAVGLCDPHHPAIVPQNLPLSDDTLLDKMDLKDGESVVCTQLSPLEQVLILAQMESHRRAVAQENLTEEEVMAYLQYIIEQVSSWAVAVAALTQRSRLECNSRRHVERAMQQLEVLVNHIQKPEPNSAVRLQLFYAAQPPTTWALQSELAALLLSMGCVGAALDIYLRLQLWENVIACYQRLGKREKAESVIREQLAIKETPTLLCFLGDVTRDKTHYIRAWELSNQRSARAMRCLAYVYFSEEKYEEAVECFEKSLALNSLQIPVWFSCGCACMAAKNYEAAAKAFKRCVSLDYDNFEAWSNLATAYARMKKKRLAFLTVKDAIKCNYESWRLWENCLVFATDCGEFKEVIRAYHRLLDLKEKWIDTEVLRIVVNAVLTDMADAGGEPSVQLLPMLLELFGRITSKVTNNEDIWQLYGDLCRAQTPNHNADLEKATQCLQKSLRCMMQKAGWEKEQEQCEKVAQQALQLAKTYQLCVEQMSNSQQAVQTLSSAKLMLKGVVTKIKQQHTDAVSKLLAESVKDMCQMLDKELQTVTDQVEQLHQA